MRYTVRQMVFMGRPTKVLVCNNRMSSALTSLTNFFILSNELNLGLLNRKYTLDSQLERFISRRALDSLMYVVAHPGAETQMIVNDYFEITKRLIMGIEVNPVPSNSAEFEASREIEFFHTLGVPLFHASTFNVQMSLPMNFYVVSKLQEQLQAGNIGILYLNEGFNTICKHNGTVYMLIEDEGLYNNDPSASWKTMVNQKEIFAPSDFSYITACIDKTLYQCSRCSKKFCIGINYERHLETHVPAYKSTLNHSWNTNMFVKYWDEISYEDAYSILSNGGQAVEISHGSPVESIMKNWILSSEFLVAPPEVKGAVRQLTELKAKKWFADKMVQANVAAGLLSTEENEPSEEFF